MNATRRKVRRRAAIGIALFGASLLIVAAAASAAEAPTRDEYVSGLERICKPDAEATQRAMKGARGAIRAARPPPPPRASPRGAVSRARAPSPRAGTTAASSSPGTGETGGAAMPRDGPGARRAGG